MLAIDRYAGTGLWIGDGIRVHVQRINDRKVRLLVEAPRDVTVLRDELNGKRLGKESPESIAAKRDTRRRKRRLAAARKAQQADPKPKPGQAPLGPLVAGLHRERESEQLSLAERNASQELEQFAVREGMDAERQAVDLLRGREFDDAA